MMFYGAFSQLKGFIRYSLSVKLLSRIFQLWMHMRGHFKHMEISLCWG